MLDRKKVIDLLLSNLRPLDPWLKDPDVTEIMVNPGGVVFVERKGEKVCHGTLLTENQIVTAIKAMAKAVRGEANRDDASAIVDSNIEDLRIAGALAPIAPDGSFLTIRKHQDKSRRPTLEDLVHKWKSLTQWQADTLVDLVINQHKNCIIAGGTGSGKTTLTNALLSKIPDSERVITIEDTSELQVTAPNKVPLISNATKGVTARMLVKLAMRSYPDRLVLGETRGDETFDLIRAFNSGHDGSISTVHASSAQAALSAVEMLFQMSVPSGASLSGEMVRRYIAGSVNVVVYAERRSVIENGVSRTVRRIENIYLVKGVTNGKYDLEPVVPQGLHQEQAGGVQGDDLQSRLGTDAGDRTGIARAA